MFKHAIVSSIAGLLLLSSCQQGKSGFVGELTPITLEHATNLTLQQGEHYAVATLDNPWKEGATLQTYVLLDSTLNEPPAGVPDGVVLHVPLKRSIVFTTAHASLLEMLRKQEAVCGVADAKYMLLDYVHQGVENHTIADCGDAMNSNVERIVQTKADALLLSPFEGASFGQLEKSGVPIIQCADYMETSALGRAEWMKFYGLLFGAEDIADSLFHVVCDEYEKEKKLAATAQQTLSVLPDRRVGYVWYVPGGKSSVGMLYRDACGKYAYADDTHSGSLTLPFETVLQQFGNADIWLMSCQDSFSKDKLLAEFQGYENLKPFKDGEIYGVKVDSVPYFEQVSWRPDWLLSDLIKLFHPDLRPNKELKKEDLRYYEKIE